MEEFALIKSRVNSNRVNQALVLILILTVNSIWGVVPPPLTEKKFMKKNGKFCASHKLSKTVLWARNER